MLSSSKECGTMEGHRLFKRLKDEGLSDVHMRKITADVFRRYHDAEDYHRG